MAKAGDVITSFALAAPLSSLSSLTSSSAAASWMATPLSPHPDGSIIDTITTTSNADATTTSTPVTASASAVAATATTTTTAAVELSSSLSGLFATSREELEQTEEEKEKEKEEKEESQEKELHHNQVTQKSSPVTTTGSNGSGGSSNGGSGSCSDGSGTYYYHQLLWTQDAMTRSTVATCENCARHLGNYCTRILAETGSVDTLASALVMTSSKKSGLGCDTKAKTTDGEGSDGHGDGCSNVLCQCAQGCGALYCSEKCRDEVVRMRHHAALCTGPIENQDHPLLAFKRAALVSGMVEEFSLAARAICVPSSSNNSNISSGEDTSWLWKASAEFTPLWQLPGPNFNESREEIEPIQEEEEKEEDVQKEGEEEREEGGGEEREEGGGGEEGEAPLPEDVVVSWASSARALCQDTWISLCHAMDLHFDGNEWGGTGRTMEDWGRLVAYISAHTVSVATPCPTEEEWVNLVASSAEDTAAEEEEEEEEEEENGTEGVGDTVVLDHVIRFCGTELMDRLEHEQEIAAERSETESDTEVETKIEEGREGEQAKEMAHDEVPQTSRELLADLLEDPENLFPDRRLHLISPALVEPAHSCWPSAVWKLWAPASSTPKLQLVACRSFVVRKKDEEEEEKEKGEVLTVSRLPLALLAEDGGLEDRRVALEAAGLLAPGQNCGCTRCCFERGIQDETGVINSGERPHIDTSVLHILLDLAMDQERIGDAQALIDALLARNSTDGQALYLRAVMASWEGEHANSRAQLERLAAEIPGHARTAKRLQQLNAYYAGSCMRDKIAAARVATATDLTSRPSFVSSSAETVTSKADIVADLTQVPNVLIGDGSSCGFTTKAIPGLEKSDAFVCESLLPVDECAHAIEAAEKYTAKHGGWNTSRHYAVPTTDVPVHLVPEVLTWFNSALRDYIFPLLDSHFGGGKPGSLRVLDAFVVRYDADRQRALPLHRDESELSFTLALNSGDRDSNGDKCGDGTDFTGGGTFFAKAGRAVVTKAGGLVAFRGNLLHSGHRIRSGVRYIIAAFLYREQDRTYNRKLGKIIDCK